MALVHTQISSSKIHFTAEDSTNVRLLPLYGRGALSSARVKPPRSEHPPGCPNPPTSPAESTGEEATPRGTHLEPFLPASHRAEHHFIIIFHPGNTTAFFVHPAAHQRPNHLPALRVLHCGHAGESICEETWRKSNPGLCLSWLRPQRRHRRAAGRHRRAPAWKAPFSASGSPAARSGLTLAPAQGSAIGFVPPSRFQRGFLGANRESCTWPRESPIPGEAACTTAHDLRAKKVFERKTFTAALFPRDTGSWATLLSVYPFRISLWICRAAAPCTGWSGAGAVSPALPETRSRRVCFGPGSQRSTQAGELAGAGGSISPRRHEFFLVGRGKAGTRGEEREGRRWPLFSGAGPSPTSPFLSLFML